MHFQKVVITLVMLLISIDSYSQIKDSIPQKARQVVTDKFPITRPLNIEYRTNTPYDFTSKLHNNSLPDGKLNVIHQLNASTNFHFIKKPKWTLGATVNYNYLSTEIDNPDWTSGEISKIKEDFHYHFTSLNFTYFSSLFKKMIIYTGSINVDGSQHHFERLRGMATATLLLKATPTTKMTVGLVGIIDPYTQVPIIPTFTYEHKFQNGWTADVILPKGAFLRKNIFKEGRLSIGSEMEFTTFYLYDLDNTNDTYKFNQLEINSGLTYEHHLGNSFIATIKTGLKTIPNSRISKKTEKASDYIFESKPDASMFFNVGLSFNPFGKN